MDFLKVLAAIFITNSHFIPLYKDISPSLATFGVHGNALFFFVSGFVLMMGFEKKKDLFVNWYKKRIQRLWPSVFLWSIIAAIIWKDPITWKNLLIANNYWFLQCIAIYYILFYIFGNLNISIMGGGICVQKILFMFSIAASLLYFYFMPKATGSIFHTNLHFVCHFSIMIMGGMTYLYKDKIKIKALNQCARELLLLQTSDWEFNLTCYRVMEYSYERINAHIERFNKLYEQIEQNTIDEQYLKNIEWKDKILPELDYRDYISNK